MVGQLKEREETEKSICVHTVTRISLPRPRAMPAIISIVNRQSANNGKKREEKLHTHDIINFRDTVNIKQKEGEKRRYYYFIANFRDSCISERSSSSSS